MRALGVVFLAALLCGCTYNAKPVAVSSAAAEIQSNRVSKDRVNVYIEPAVLSLTAEADTGYTCSAHKFPVEAGDAVASSIRKVVEGAFPSYEIRETANYEGPDLDMRVILDSFKVTLGFDAGFWQATANANAELVLKVDVNRNGQPVTARATIAGEGSGRKEGGCGEGAAASAEAVEKAIKRTMENLIYKLINSGAIAGQS